jgi:hypothetical protein
MALARRAPPSFSRVEIEPARTDQTPQRLETVLPQPVVSPRPSGLIEIVLPNGVTLRVDTAVDERALRRVLAALSPR